MSRNSTDYEFPADWGLYSDEQKHDWFVRERVFRQAIRQNTAFGRSYQDAQNGESREHGVEMSRAWKRAGRGGFRK